MTECRHRILNHIILVTKQRTPMISEAIRPALYSRIHRSVDSSSSRLLGLGGTNDHIHLLVDLSPSSPLAALLNQIRRDSSRWARREGAADFAWDRGYGSFSVSPLDLDNLLRFIRDQADHHRLVSFEEEYLQLLERYGVEPH